MWIMRKVSMVGADVLGRPQSQANAYFRYVTIAGHPEVSQNRNLLSLE